LGRLKNHKNNCNCFICKVLRRETKGVNNANYKYISKDFLLSEYIDKQKTMKQIAQIIGCMRETVRRRIHEYNIPVRNYKECQLGKSRNKGKKHGQYKGKKAIYNGKYSCKDCGKQISTFSGYYGQKRCQSCDMVNRHKIGIFDNKISELKRKKMFIGLSVRPNRPEKIIEKLLQKIFPKEYKYVGNGEIVLGQFNPDFININGQKKIIELYGNYWHNRPKMKERDKRRIITYAKYGYKTLIIWEHELNDLKQVKEKILEFHRGKFIF